NEALPQRRDRGLVVAARRQVLERAAAHPDLPARAVGVAEHGFGGDEVGEAAVHGCTQRIMAGLVQPCRGDNGSAFFFRLPSRAKWAMAEILFSDCVECRPPLLIGGLFRDVPPWTTRDHVSGYFRLFRLFCALFFSLLAIVSAPAAFPSSAQGLAL